VRPCCLDQECRLLCHLIHWLTMSESFLPLLDGCHQVMLPHMITHGSPSTNVVARADRSANTGSYAHVAEVVVGNAAGKWMRRSGSKQLTALFRGADYKDDGSTKPTNHIRAGRVPGTCNTAHSAREICISRSDKTNVYRFVPCFVADTCSAHVFETDETG